VENARQLHWLAAAVYGILFLGATLLGPPGPGLFLFVLMAALAVLALALARTTDRLTPEELAEPRLRVARLACSFTVFLMLLPLIRNHPPQVFTTWLVLSTLAASGPAMLLVLGARKRAVHVAQAYLPAGPGLEKARQVHWLVAGFYAAFALQSFAGTPLGAGFPSLVTVLLMALALALVHVRRELTDEELASGGFWSAKMTCLIAGAGYLVLQLPGPLPGNETGWFAVLLATAMGPLAILQTGWPSAAAEPGPVSAASAEFLLWRATRLYVLTTLVYVALFCVALWLGPPAAPLHALAWALFLSLLALGLAQATERLTAEQLDDPGLRRATLTLTAASLLFVLPWLLHGHGPATGPWLSLLVFVLAGLLLADVAQARKRAQRRTSCAPGRSPGCQALAELGLSLPAQFVVLTFVVFGPTSGGAFLGPRWLLAACFPAIVVVGFLLTRRLRAASLPVLADCSQAPREEAQAHLADLARAVPQGSPSPEPAFIRLPPALPEPWELGWVSLTVSVFLTLAMASGGFAWATGQAVYRDWWGLLSLNVLVALALRRRFSRPSLALLPPAVASIWLWSAHPESSPTGWASVVAGAALVSLWLLMLRELKSGLAVARPVRGGWAVHLKSSGGWREFEPRESLPAGDWVAAAAAADVAPPLPPIEAPWRPAWLHLCLLFGFAAVAIIPLSRLGLEAALAASIVRHPDATPAERHRVGHWLLGQAQDSALVHAVVSMAARDLGRDGEAMATAHRALDLSGQPKGLAAKLAISVLRSYARLDKMALLARNAARAEPVPGIPLEARESVELGRQWASLPVRLEELDANAHAERGRAILAPAMRLAPTWAEPYRVLAELELSLARALTPGLPAAEEAARTARRRALEAGRHFAVRQGELPAVALQALVELSAGGGSREASEFLDTLAADQAASEAPDHWTRTPRGSASVELARVLWQYHTGQLEPATRGSLRLAQGDLARWGENLPLVATLAARLGSATAGAAPALRLEARGSRLEERLASPVDSSRQSTTFASSSSGEPGLARDVLARADEAASGAPLVALMHYWELERLGEPTVPRRTADAVLSLASISSARLVAATRARLCVDPSAHPAGSTLWIFSDRELSADALTWRYPDLMVRVILVEPGELQAVYGASFFPYPVLLNPNSVELASGRRAIEVLEGWTRHPWPRTREVPGGPLRNEAGYWQARQLVQNAWWFTGADRGGLLRQTEEWFNRP
jgi:hypothetical protein